MEEIIWARDHPPPPPPNETRPARLSHAGTQQVTHAAPWDRGSTGSADDKEKRLKKNAAMGDFKHGVGVHNQNWAQVQPSPTIDLKIP